MGLVTPTVTCVLPMKDLDAYPRCLKQHIPGFDDLHLEFNIKFASRQPASVMAHPGEVTYRRWSTLGVRQST